jgi:hypothetical protein
MSRDFDYENNNIGYDEQYPEGGIKCKNYELCSSVLPEWWFDCKGHYLCINCDMMFGTWKSGKGVLKIHDSEECPICYEYNRCISYPNCNHFACITCFRRCMYGDESREGEPVFPYPDIEDDYDNDRNLNLENYPLIKVYNEEWNKWEDDKETKYHDEKNLRKCSLCRK